MSTPSKFLIVSSLVIFSSAAARAETLVLKAVDGVSSGIGASKNTVLSINGGSSYAGVYDLEIDGRAAQGFCVEPAQSVSLNTPYIYQALSLDAAYPGAPQRVNDLELLLGKYGSLPMTPLHSAALQISLWEITGDDRAYDLGGGNFSIVDTNTLQAGGFTDSEAIELARDWLANLTGTKRARVTVYRHDTAQDIITWQNVPDGGSTVALSGLSLLGLTVARRLFRSSGV